MKPGLGWTRDPALHLIALSTAILGTALALSSHPGVGQRRPADRAPAGLSCLLGLSSRGRGGARRLPDPDREHRARRRR